MLKKIIVLFILLFIPLLTQAQNPNFKVNFEAAEHLFLGDQIVLRFTDDETRQGNKLTLPNGLQLTYGELISLGGDFYAVPSAPIIRGANESERKVRFKNAFNTLAVDVNAVTEAPKLLTIIYEEMQLVKEGLERGEDLKDIYSKMATDHNADWNCITGGLCMNDYPGMNRELFKKVFYLKQGRYLQLAIQDFDHFSTNAFAVYEVGHSLALELAKDAHKNNDMAKLELAYAMNAFACHYLSDLFASGHMRLPRNYLYDKITPSIVGSLLAMYMHKEDNAEGLVAANKRGDLWKGYGDGLLFDPRNQRIRDMLIEVLQISANEIFNTFKTGNIPTSSAINEIIPDFQKLTATTQDYKNISPLFFWDPEKKQLLRRNNLTNVYDYTHSAYWLGWATLTELVAIYGTSPRLQALLLLDKDTRDLAIKHNLIKDKEILQFYFKNKSRLIDANALHRKI